MLNTNDLITLVRSGVNVQLPDSEVIDPSYLTMTDEDILLLIKLGASHAYPEIESLNDLPNGAEYPIVLLAKIELYNKLAVLNANKVDLGADNNNYLKQHQRFLHYSELAKAAKSEYSDWLENESLNHNVVGSYDVLLGNRHYTQRNYEKQPTPKVRISIDDVFDNGVNISWKVLNTSHFGRFKVYISTSPIFNKYVESLDYRGKISQDAELVKSTGNIRDTTHSVIGLSPATLYYVLVLSIERNQVYGYSETSFTTLESIAEEDVNKNSI